MSRPPPSRRRWAAAALWLLAAPAAASEGPAALCRLLLDQGRAADAVAPCGAALDERRAGRDRGAEAKALDSFGQALEGAGRYEDALRAYEGRLSLARELVDERAEANAHNQLGDVLDSLSRHEEAMEHYERALAAARRLGDRSLEAVSLSNVGAEYGELGRYERALEFHERALAIEREVKDRHAEAVTLSNLGWTFDKMSRYDRALEHHRAAAAALRDLGDRRGEAISLSNTGVVLSELARYQSALETYERALAIHRELKDRHGEAIVLSNTGNSLAKLGRHPEAVERYERALEIMRETGDRKGEGGVLSNLGRALGELGRHADALECHQKALAVFRAVKDRQKEGIALHRIGVSLAATGRGAEALEPLGLALEALGGVMDRHREAEVLVSLAAAFRSLGQVAAALYYGKQAVNAFEEIRASLRSMDRESRESFLRSKEGAYRSLADLLVDEGRIPEAQRVLGLMKGDELATYLGGAATVGEPARLQLTRQEAKLAGERAALARQLTALEEVRGGLKDGAVSAADAASLEAKLTEAHRAFAAHLARVERALAQAPGAPVERVGGPPEVGLMTGELERLGTGTVALSTLVTRERYRVIVATHEGRVAREFAIGRGELARAVHAFREALEDPRRDPRAPAQQLYKILVGPVEADLARAKAKTLMWSLDGVLRYVPVAALHDGRRYLVERYRSSVFTPGSAGKLRTAPARAWTAWGFGASKGGSGFRALPGVREELRAIIRAPGAATGVLRGDVWMDEAFTREALLSALEGRARRSVVHIASHFQFRPGSAAESFLLLGDGGRLSLEDLAVRKKLFSGVELLTLSACETAVAETPEAGQEVEGFGALAQRLGAGAVLATLWSVEDESTRRLMAEFYRGREAAPARTKGEALRQAQLALLTGRAQAGPSPALRSAAPARDELGDGAGNSLTADRAAPYSHPYYWAPFVLMGSWE